MPVKFSPEGMTVASITTTVRNAISSPATGTLIYNSTTGTYQIYNGSAWATIGF